MHTFNTFASKQELDTSFATTVANLLKKAVEEKGKASIAVSGGSTPKGFFNALSQTDIDWSKVTVTLADERWVPQVDEASNSKLVKENLLVNNAAAAGFFEIQRDGELSQNLLNSMCLEAEEVLPLDVLILGMGGDGHTASLFPCSSQLEDALSPEAPALMKTVPTTAPHERITFSFPALAKSKNTFLHIVGESKKSVLEDALSSQDVSQMPIRAFLQDDANQVSIFWAE